jgi:hypothetical protein
MFVSAMEAATSVHDAGRPGEATEAADEFLIAAFKLQSAQVALQRKAMADTAALPEFPK